MKKFVYENQGLVRRMYGDMRHFFVVQSELENEVDFEDLQYSADKYSKAFNTHNQRQQKAKKVVTERKNFRSDSEPYFRPAQRPSAVNSKQKTKPPKTGIATEATETNNENLLLDNLIKSNVDAIVEDLKKKDDNLASLEGSTRATTKLTSVASSSSTTPSSATTTSKEELLFDMQSDDATTIDKVVANFFNNISSAVPSTTPNAPANVSSVDDIKTKISSTLTNELLIDVDNMEPELEQETANDLAEVASNVGEVFAESDGLDKNSSKEPQTTTTETQLFQDTVQKEKEPAPIVNRRGV